MDKRIRYEVGMVTIMFYKYESLVRYFLSPEFKSRVFRKALGLRPNDIEGAIAWDFAHRDFSTGKIVSINVEALKFDKSNFVFDSQKLMDLFHQRPLLIAEIPTIEPFHFAQKYGYGFSGYKITDEEMKKIFPHHPLHTPYFSSPHQGGYDRFGHRTNKINIDIATGIGKGKIPIPSFPPDPEVGSANIFRKIWTDEAPQWESNYGILIPQKATPVEYFRYRSLFNIVQKYSGICWKKYYYLILKLNGKYQTNKMHNRYHKQRRKKKNKHLWKFYQTKS